MTVALVKPPPLPIIFSYGEWLAMDEKPVPQLVKNLLPIEGLVVMQGPAKAMKSFVALHMAYQMAAGLKVFGRFASCKPLRVLYLDQELGHAEVGGRLTAIHKQEACNAIYENLILSPRYLKMKVDNPEGIALIHKRIVEAQPDVVVYDPLVCFHSQPDENSNALMHSKVMEPLMEIQQEHGVASVVVHHTGKLNQTMDLSSPTIGRGASTIAGDADTLINVVPGASLGPNETNARLHFITRFSKKLPHMDLRPRQIVVGKDYDGEDKTYPYFTIHEGK